MKTKIGLGVLVLGLLGTAPAQAGFVNPGFEAPFVPNNAFNFFAEAFVPGWSTTASDHVIEIWGDTFLGVPAFEGRQFAELNCKTYDLI